MAKPYTLPDWAAMPLFDFSIEVLKEGAIVDNIDISAERMNNIKKSYVIFGRQPDIVDIQLDHPSISRQHAILQYRDDGALMLLDLNSAQGTYLNKSKLEPGSYHRVFVGDCIKFGASTRMYFVSGPESQRKEEYDSANMQAYRDKIVKYDEKIKSKVEDDRNTGVSWGMAEDAPEESDDDDDDDDEDEGNSKKSKMPWYLKNDENYDRKYGDSYSVDISESEVPTKDAKLFEKVKRIEAKIRNMQNENKRIYLKENNQAGEFTEGQMAAIARNDARIKDLMEQNEELIAQIKGKIERKNELATSIGNKRQHSNIEEDDIYDTTAQTADASSNWRLRKKQQQQLVKSTGSSLKQSSDQPEVQTYEKLCEQKNILLQKQGDNNELLVALRDEVASLTNCVISDEEELDVIMRKTKLQDLQIEITKAEKEKNELETTFRRLIKLIDIAKPALSSFC